MVVIGWFSSRCVGRELNRKTTAKGSRDQVSNAVPQQEARNRKQVARSKTYSSEKQEVSSKTQETRTQQYSSEMQEAQQQSSEKYGSKTYRRNAAQK
jgi:ribosomal protein L29